jgi:uncharacterized protein YkwD
MALTKAVLGGIILSVLVALGSSYSVDRLAKRWMGRIQLDSTQNAAACVKAHNHFRRLHVGTPDVEWDTGMAAEAQVWADKLAGLGYMEHSRPNPPGSYGENLFFAANTAPNFNPSCYDAVKAWYDEIKDYDFGNPTFAAATGHFTQVVWKTSTKIGMGFASAKSGPFTKVFAVARYKKAGNMNMPGYFKANVGELKSAGDSRMGIQMVGKALKRDATEQLDEEMAEIIEGAMHPGHP